MNSQTKPNRLYILTLLIEFFVSSMARLTLYILLTIIPLILMVAGMMLLENGMLKFLATILFYLVMILGLVISFGPLVLSILAYAEYGGGHTLTRLALGAREPSRRELQQIQEVQRRIIDASGRRRINGFSGTYIIDSPTEMIYLIGRTLYLSSGSLRSRHFQQMLAHELGHNQQGDGAMILALRRLVLPIFYVFVGKVRDFSTARPASRERILERPEVDIRIPDMKSLDSDPAATFYSMVNSLIFFLFSFVGGGLGVWLTSGLWARYFRERDYLADRFVIESRMKDELVDYLEIGKFYDTSVPYMLGWQPANEQRIDKILRA